MNDLEASLALFTKTDLQEVERFKPQERIEQKFVFHRQLLPDVLRRLSTDYMMLEVAHQPLIPYETLYYDSPDFLLYLAHHRGKLNRYKVRYRRYPESGLAYLEIKSRSNQGISRKKRWPVTEQPSELNTEHLELPLNSAGHTKLVLQPRVWVNYQRISLVNKHNSERLTFDLGLRCKTDDHSAEFPQMVIAELKRSTQTASHLPAILREMKIPEISLSKYCLAVATLFPQMKSNRFKELLRSIHKIEASIAPTR